MKKNEIIKNTKKRSGKKYHGIKKRVSISRNEMSNKNDAWIAFSRNRVGSGVTRIRLNIAIQWIHMIAPVNFCGDWE